jgi:hypothetical protein
VCRWLNFSFASTTPKSPHKSLSYQKIIKNRKKIPTPPPTFLQQAKPTTPFLLITQPLKMAKKRGKKPNQPPQFHSPLSCLALNEATPKAKPTAPEPSKHSRAARRATSPSIDVDKSVKELKPARDPILRPSVLAARESSGVSKKKSQGRKMSARARRRHERGMQMAEAVLERTSTKVEKSKGRGRAVQDRAKAWELINKKAAEEEQREKEEEDEKKEGWETDEDMDAPEAKGAEANKGPDDDQLAGADYIPIDEDDVS